MSIAEKRQIEVDKYDYIYGLKRPYTINKIRLDQAVHGMQAVLQASPDAKTLLDVGCGDGAWIKHLEKAFNLECRGVEPVASQANDKVITGLATDLPFPDNSFDIVSCLDVMEHLVPEDSIPALQEIARVSRGGCLITISNTKSVHRGLNDSELHVNRRPFDEWIAMLEQVFHNVEMLENFQNLPGNRAFALVV